MFGIVSVASTAPKKKKYDDDTIDRLHNRYTVVILVVFAVIVSSAQYVGSPMHCWLPAHFTGAWSKYTTNLCWVNNTYYVPLIEDTPIPKLTPLNVRAEIAFFQVNNTYYVPLSDDAPIPRAHEIDPKDRIGYYQWIPFILLTQALFFFIPSVFWRAFNSKSGVDSDNILKAAQRLSRSKELEQSTNILKLIRNQIDHFVSNPHLEQHRSLLQRLYSMLFCVCGLWTGSYLIILYIFVKLLYVANVVGQLFALSFILKTHFSLYSLSWFFSKEDVLDEEEFLGDRVFPKVTFCDVHIRELGNNQRYTVQCVLPVNLFAQRMYMFLGWWFLFILIITIFNLFVWMLRSLFRRDRVAYMRNHLKRLHNKGKIDYDDKGDKELVKLFIYHYLKNDGIFLLRMIGHNTDQLTVEDVIASLWKHWNQKCQERARRNSTIAKGAFDLDKDRFITSSPGAPDNEFRKPPLIERMPSIPSAPTMAYTLDNVDAKSGIPL